MNLKSLLVTASLVAATATARADESDLSFFSRPMTATTGALEIGVATGFTHAAGRLESGLSLDDSGGTFELDLGYRLSPHVSIGWYGTFTDFGAIDAQGTDTLGLSTGVQARWHLAPYRAFDPWVQVGGGFHAYIFDAPGDAGLAYVGLDLVRLQVGADFRLTPRLSVSPIVGIDVTTFLSTVDDWDRETSIADKRLSVFVFAGLGGRFDLGGRDVAEPTRDVVIARGF